MVVATIKYVSLSPLDLHPPEYVLDGVALGGGDGLWNRSWDLDGMIANDMRLQMCGRR
jgi:hypothetical protein